MKVDISKYKFTDEISKRLKFSPGRKEKDLYSNVRNSSNVEHHVIVLGDVDQFDLFYVDMNVENPDIPDDIKQFLIDSAYDKLLDFLESLLNMLGSNVNVVLPSYIIITKGCVPQNSNRFNPDVGFFFRYLPFSTL